MSRVQLISAFTAGRRQQELRRAGIVRVDGFAAPKAAAGRGFAGLAVLMDICAARFTVLMGLGVEPPIGALTRRSAGGGTIINR